GPMLRSAIMRVSRLRISHKLSSVQVIVISVMIVFIAALCAAALFWHSNYWQSVIGVEGLSRERIAQAAFCRAGLFIEKAQGKISELSWVELWEMTRLRSAFHCGEGRSMEASLQYSSAASEEDRAEGARIFRERCSICHGGDGLGGPNGPSLTRPQY